MHKRKVEEFVALYGLESGLKDLFVEGEVDRNFFEWFLHEMGIHGVRVHSADELDISNEELVAKDLNPNSNRSKLVLLSEGIAERSPDGSNVVNCVIDKDFEDFIPTRISNQILLFTDCTSLELYAYSEATLTKFGKLVLGGISFPANELMDKMRGVLERVFLIRLANEMLKWGMTEVDFSRYVDVTGTSIVFNERDFLKAYLMKNCRYGKRVQFEETLLDLSMRAKAVPGCKIRGHDFVDFVLFLIKKIKYRRKFDNHDNLQGTLLCALEIENLKSSPLFAKIIQAYA